MEDLKKLIEVLKNDGAINDTIKISILEWWKEKLIQSNAGRIMDKDMAEKHFECLSIIKSAVTSITIIKSA